MVTYKYVALNQTGDKVTGMIEAIDRLEATARIRNQYQTVVSLKEVNNVGSQLSGILNMELFSNRLNPKAFTLMCSQFATILEAGVPIARAIRLIADKTTDKTLKNMLIKVGDDVEAGRAMSSSFEEHGAGFLPPTFVETVRAGEEAGDLPNSFESIYRHFDKQTKMNDKVRAAMTYPVFVLVIAVIVVIVMMTRVVPTFTSIFEDLGSQMPLMTRILINISTFISNTFVYFVVIVAIIVVALMAYNSTEAGRMRLSKLQLSLPVLGNIAQLNAASLFANTMATMIGAGLPMTKCVSITAKVMTNYLIQTKVAAMTARIEEGHTVVESMREADALPDILIDMVGVGEETGELKKTLDTVARYYDTELELAITNAIAMLEPALLCFIAVVTGFIVISIYASMFEMYNSM